MHTIIAFDDSNNDCKLMFQGCADSTRQILVNNNKPYTLITASDLNKFHVKKTVMEQSRAECMFVAYSHGNNDSLSCSNCNEPYLSTNINAEIFEDKIIYTYSCKSGKELGYVLCGNKAKGYIGYTEEVCHSWKNIDTFIDCATFGLNAIIEGRSLIECIQEMKEKYTLEYDNLIEQNDPIGASYLLNARTTLVLIQR